jgi:replicative DNA helicase
MPLVSLKDSLKNTVDIVRERQQQGGIEYVGIPTGFYKFDDLTGGLRRGTIGYIGGRTGMGKTGLAFTIARNVAALGKSVLYISLEMKAEMMALRFLAGQTGIPAQQIERGQLTDDELRKVEQVIEQTKNIMFHVFDDSLDSKGLYRQAKSYQQEYGLDLLIVDYITLLTDPGSQGQVARVTEISRSMQQTAFDLNIPVIGLSQLNREVEKRENNMPTLSDLRDSGAVEQDADWVLFCYRLHHYAMMHDQAEPKKIEDDAKLILAKNRHGGVGQFSVTFIPDRSYWYLDTPTPTDPQNTNMGKLKAKVREGR